MRWPSTRPQRNRRPVRPRRRWRTVTPAAVAAVDSGVTTGAVDPAPVVAPAPPTDAASPATSGALRIRRALPRVSGGEPWPPSQTAPASGAAALLRTRRRWNRPRRQHLPSRRRWRPRRSRPPHRPRPRPQSSNPRRSTPRPAVSVVACPEWSVATLAARGHCSARADSRRTALLEPVASEHARCRRGNARSGRDRRGRRRLCSGHRRRLDASALDPHGVERARTASHPCRTGAGNRPPSSDLDAGDRRAVRRRRARSARRSGDRLRADAPELPVHAGLPRSLPRRVRTRDHGRARVLALDRLAALLQHVPDGADHPLGPAGANREAADRVLDARGNPKGRSASTSGSTSRSTSCGS